MIYNRIRDQEYVKFENGNENFKDKIDKNYLETNIDVKETTGKYQSNIKVFLKQSNLRLFFSY